MFTGGRRKSTICIEEKIVNMRLIEKRTPYSVGEEGILKIRGKRKKRAILRSTTRRNQGGKIILRRRMVKERSTASRFIEKSKGGGKLRI